MENVLVAENAAARKPRTSPLMSPKLPTRSMSSPKMSLDLNAGSTSASGFTPVAASFDVKFKAGKTYVVTSKIDLGGSVHDEARFRDAITEVNWADIEAFSKETGVSIPPGLHILLPPLRSGLIRRWFDLVAAERGVSVVLHFLHADDIVRFPPRLNRVFSRALEDPSDDLILG